MNFVKGAIVGMFAGAIVGVMNSDEIIDAIRMGKKEFKKMKRKCGC